MERFIPRYRLAVSVANVCSQREHFDLAGGGWWMAGVGEIVCVCFVFVLTLTSLGCFFFVFFRLNVRCPSGWLVPHFSVLAPGS